MYTKVRTVTRSQRSDAGHAVISSGRSKWDLPRQHGDFVATVTISIDKRQLPVLKKAVDSLLDDIAVLRGVAGDAQLADRPAAHRIRDRSDAATDVSASVLRRRRPFNEWRHRSPAAAATTLCI